MILDTSRNTSPRLAKMRLGFVTTAAALVAFATIYAAPRVILAQNEAAHAPAPAAGAPTAAPGGDQVPVLGDIPLLGRLFRSEAASAKKKDALIAVAALPEIADPDTSEAPLPGTPAPKAVGPGPKFKPGSPKPPLAVPAPAIPSTPSVSPGIPAPPTPMIATVQPAPFASPRTPRPPRARPGDSSLEERLDRLEHMVESLIAERGERPGHPEWHLKDGMTNPKEIEKMKEYAKREAARAAEEAKRASREAERVWKAEPRRQLHAKFKEESQKQLEAMRKQLENLEREKERLREQIERLEQERQQLDEQESEDQPGPEIEKEQ